MKTFQTHFKNMTRGMEDHQFRHYNNALGCMIYSKEHYLHELKKQGMVPVDMAEERVERWEKNHGHKDYIASEKAHRLIEFFKNKCREQGGYIKFGDYPKAVAELKSMGMDFERDLDKFKKEARQ
jgi:hypothetical protein